MHGERFPSDEDWKNFSEQAEKELISTYQEEIRKRFYDLAEYIRTASDRVPNKQTMMRLSQAIAGSLSMEGQPGTLTVEKMRENFLSEVNMALKPLGFSTIAEDRLLRLEHHDSEFEGILQTGHLPDYLRNKEAAREELNRLQPWTGSHVIAEDREGAISQMEDIYTRFPELRP